MPLHIFGPPHLHLLPIVLSSALAFAAGAYYVTRNGVPAGVARLGARLKSRLRGSRQTEANSMMFSRGQFSRNSTGNSAFDEYRTATLQKLEQEGAEFRSYLDGLRHAKDKTEFDAYLKDRRDKASDVTTETLAP